MEFVPWGTSRVCRGRQSPEVGIVEYGLYSANESYAQVFVT